MQWLQMANEEVATLAWARVTVLMKQPRDRMGELQSKGRAGLCVINEQLADHSRLAGTDHLTIGDVSCFPYADMAEQGGSHSQITRMSSAGAGQLSSYRDTSRCQV
jgi:glutathione S-transferase